MTYTPPIFANDIKELGDWRPKTDAERIAYDILRQYIHRGPSLFMERVRDTIIMQIEQVKQESYRQGKLDAVKSIQDNL